MPGKFRCMVHGPWKDRGRGYYKGRLVDTRECERCGEVQDRPVVHGKRTTQASRRWHRRG